jgi:hypothetical protein
MRPSHRQHQSSPALLSTSAQNFACISAETAIGKCGLYIKENLFRSSYAEADELFTVAHNISYRGDWIYQNCVDVNDIHYVDVNYVALLSFDTAKINM